MRYFVIAKNTQLSVCSKTLDSLGVSGDYKLYDADSMIKSYEDLYVFLNSNDNKKGDFCIPLLIDNTLPIWNHESIKSIQALGLKEFSFLSSYEMTGKEISLLNEHISSDTTLVCPIYGYVPLMKSKNCIKKTNGTCDGVSELIRIKDRKGVYFPVYCNCKDCNNTIYNSVPLSLHNILKKERIDVGGLGIIFTIEDEKTVEQVLRYYVGLFRGKVPGEFPIEGHTTGHFSKKVL